MAVIGIYDTYRWIFSTIHRNRKVMACLGIFGESHGKREIVIHLKQTGT